MNFILYCIIIMLCRVIAILYEWKLMEIMWRVMVGIGAVSFISIVYAYFRIKISVDTSVDRIMKGRKLPIEIKIKNKSFFPTSMVRVKFESVNCFYDEKSKCKFDFPIRKWGKQKYIFNITAGRCGNLTVRLKNVRLKDWLNLFTVYKKINKEICIPVIPEFSEKWIDEPYVNNAVYLDTDVFSKIKAGDDPSEVFDIRNMREDDSIKRVNWKVSAKKQTYMVNEYSLPEGKGIVIFLDMCFDGTKEKLMNTVDCVLEKFMQICVNLQEYEEVFDVVWFDKNTERCHIRHITPEDDVADIFSKIYECGIYSGNSKLMNIFNMQYENKIMSHLHYIACSVNEKVICEICDGRDNTIKNIWEIQNDKGVDKEEYCNAFGVEIERFA